MVRKQLVVSVVLVSALLLLNAEAKSVDPYKVKATNSLWVSTIIAKLKSNSSLKVSYACDNFRFLEYLEMQRRVKSRKLSTSAYLLQF